MNVENKIIIKENNKEKIIKFENLDYKDYIKWTEKILIKIMEEQGYKVENKQKTIKEKMYKEEKQTKNNKRKNV